MKFRPCIDIHNGQVKQIVGGSLQDLGDVACENFVASQDAAFFARLYEKYNLQGGHIILLNGKDSPYYEATKAQAVSALKAYPKAAYIAHAPFETAPLLFDSTAPAPVVPLTLLLYQRVASFSPVP